jgi:hypothetical protein
MAARRYARPEALREGADRLETADRRDREGYLLAAALADAGRRFMEGR